MFNNNLAIFDSSVYYNYTQEWDSKTEYITWDIAN